MAPLVVGGVSKEKGEAMKEMGEPAAERTPKAGLSAVIF